MSDVLQSLRGELDQVDAQLVTLFERRMQIARQVGAYKRQHGLPVLDEAREAAVLQSRVDRLQDPAWADAARELFTHIMRLSRQEQQRAE